MSNGEKYELSLYIELNQAERTTFVGIHKRHRIIFAMVDPKLLKKRCAK